MMSLVIYHKYFEIKILMMMMMMMISIFHKEADLHDGNTHKKLKDVSFYDI